MKPFDVYPLFNITPVQAEGSYIRDSHGTRYLDLYGGHAVISIGHSHPHYLKRLQEQMHAIAFYSNSVRIPQQEELAEKLGQLSGYPDFALFLCNSGAEANENALKLASFHNKRSKVIAFRKSFHGRTSLAVAATDDANIQARVNNNHEVVFLPLNDIASFDAAMDETVCAVITEGIQGVGGVHVPETHFLQHLRNACNRTGAVLILDEIQSGYGRSGRFFAHQYSGVKPDLITVAKGMGNGFPVAGVLIAPHFEARHGMLGTTFGGNYLACAAALAVLEVMEQESLMEHAAATGAYLQEQLRTLPHIREMRGLGLMIGIELEQPCAPIRSRLVDEEHIFTGSSSAKNTLRLLPALNLTRTDAGYFLEAFHRQLHRLS